MRMSIQSKKYIQDIDVYDVEKRYKPSKHYVYCIWVTWNDNKKQLIFRRYSQFFDLQCQLLDRFKIEAGMNDPSERIIPFLPGKILFGRSHIKSVALDRLYSINNYCKKLITLKIEISCSDLVLKFFEINNNDILQSTKHDLDKKNEENKNELASSMISNPLAKDEYICIHNYTGKSKSELSLRKNSRVHVVEKNLNGWWFVDSQDGQGYVPQCILKPLNKSLENEAFCPIISEKIEHFIVVRDYQAKKADEMNLKKGDYVQIVEKNLSGWWTVKLNDYVGVVPAVCLEEFHAANLNEPLKHSISARELFSYNNANNPINFTNNDNLPPRNDIFVSSNFQSNDNSEDTYSISSFQSFNSSASYQISANVNDDIYYVIENYTDTVGDGINLSKGQRVRVLDKENSSGWWYVKLENFMTEGWAPSAYLTKEKVKPPRPPRPVVSSIVPAEKNEKNITNYNQQPNNVSKIFNPVTHNELNVNDNISSSSLNNTETNDNSDYRPIKVSELKKKFEKNF